MAENVANYRYRRMLRSLVDPQLVDTVQTGWTDNGDGSYTCDGTNAIYVSFTVPAGLLQDGAKYRLSFEISSYTSGTFSVRIYGPDDRAIGTGRTSAGIFEEIVTIDSGTTAFVDTIILWSEVSFNGTVKDVVVTEVERP